MPLPNACSACPGHGLREQIRYFAREYRAAGSLRGKMGPERDRRPPVICAGTLSGSALVSIHCGLLHERVGISCWNITIPPLLDSGHAIHIAHVQSLSPERRDQLIGVLETDVCRRNHVIISCVPQEGRADLRRGRTVAQWVGRTFSLYLPTSLRMIAR